MSLLLLLTLTLGVANAGKLFQDIMQQGPTDRIMCPDGESSCSASGSCCQLGNGKWGCCPFMRASCCEDQVHCCPQGYSCNAAKGQCTKAIGNETMAWAKKEVAQLDATDDIGAEAKIICPDIRTTCPALASCCRSRTGSYGCCTYPNNVCCSDGHHCCRRGYICDLVSFVCRPGFLTEDSTPLALVKSTSSEQGLEWSLVKGDE